MFLSFLVTNGNDYNLVKWNYSSVHRHNFHPELEWKRCVVWNLRKGQDFRTHHYINTVISCDRQPVFFEDIMIANGGYHPQEAEEFEEEVNLPTAAVN